MKAALHTLTAKAASGEVTLDKAVFGLEPRADILHRMVVYQLAKRQAGTHRTKPRSEIRGTSQKFGRQKGSGRARHGNRKANIFVGGGRAHGPRVRSHAIGLPKKMRVLALKHALSAKARDAQIMVLEAAESKDGKTRELRKSFERLGIDNALVVDGAELDSNFVRAGRNIARVDILPVQGINVYDILRRDKLVLTKAALDALSARFSGAKQPTPKKAEAKKAEAPKADAKKPAPQKTETKKAAPQKAEAKKAAPKKAAPKKSEASK